MANNDSKPNTSFFIKTSYVLQALCAALFVFCLVLIVVCIVTGTVWATFALGAATFAVNFFTFGIQRTTERVTIRSRREGLSSVTTTEVK